MCVHPSVCVSEIFTFILSFQLHMNLCLGKAEMPAGVSPLDQPLRVPLESPQVTLPGHVLTYGKGSNPEWYNPHPLLKDIYTFLGFTGYCTPYFSNLIALFNEPSQKSVDFV